MTDPKTPAAPPVPPQPAPAQPDANGLTNGKGEPVASITSSETAPMGSQVGESFPLNTTGLGANSVDGNNVGGRSVDQGVPAGVTDRLEDQKQKEQDGE